MTLTPTITCLLDGRYELAEGLLWDDLTKHLFFCDILGKQIHAMNWDTKEVTTWDFPKVVGSFGLCKDGRLIVAMKDEIILFDTATKMYEAIAQIELDNPRTRLNDGKVGPDGASGGHHGRYQPKDANRQPLSRLTARRRNAHHSGPENLQRLGMVPGQQDHVPL